MANYKVILRQSVDQDDNFWEPGCPLIVETLQVSRNTETGEAYLQVKIKNLSAQTIDVYKRQPLGSLSSIPLVLR